ncbi:MAG: QueT transporter family protein [Bacillota bacterium]|nr:QueT transporter family protein [Bacillota bacterium]
MNTKFLVRSAIVGAVYAALTIILAPISYGMVQFRVSELMTLLVFINPAYIPGLLVGCFAANLMGAGGMIDAVFGTLASAFAFLIMVFARKIKNKNIGLIIASLGPALSSFIIALEMKVALHDKESFLLWCGSVAIGELVVVTLAGVPLYKYILGKKNIMKVISGIKE